MGDAKYEDRTGHKASCGMILFSKALPCYKRGLSTLALAALLGPVLLCAFLATTHHPGLLATPAWGRLKRSTRSLLFMIDPPLTLQPTEPVHAFGWVNKSGALDLREWHANYEQLKLRRFSDWLKGWRQHPEGVLADPPPTINLRCQVFVNHAYKFLYIRHQKTGSTSLKAYFSLCDTENQAGSCMRQLSKRIPIPQLHRMWREYLVFTVVRNPYHRALSSYKYLLSRMDSAHPCTHNLTWDSFCRDPMALGDLCRQKGCCDGTPDTFWTHTTGQDRCLLAAPGSETGPGPGSDPELKRKGWDFPPTSPPAWAVDYIARTERLGEDLREVVAEIDRRRDPGLPPLGAVVSDAGPEKQNSRPSCAESDAGGEGLARLEPQLWEGAGGRSFYGAVPQEQYCRPEQYFQPPHEKCSAALRHFFHRDFELLYKEGAGESGAGPF